MSTKSSILFAENLNFHEGNFKSLFDFIKSEKIVHAFMQPNKTMLSAFGNYYAFSDKLLEYKYLIDDYSVDKLLNYRYQNINVFDVCKSELLSYLMPQFHWRNQPIINDNEFIINKAFLENKEDLLLNMAAVMYWINFLIQEIKKYKVHDYCCVFSGSIIYSRVLLEILKTHPTKPLVMESFFTGNDYYMEFKYDALPNNTDLRHANVFNGYKLPESYFEYNKLKSKTINKILTANNKNVKQPNKDSTIYNRLPKNYLLICGQVINDFSILNTQSQINSLETYKRVINDILNNTNYSVVFKAHPWEEHKTNIRCPLTYNELKKWQELLPGEHKDRLYIESNINLDDLIMKCKGFLTICSQSALEAAFRGYKPIIIGNAFYDKFGFTHNFECSADFVSRMREGDINFKLSLDEFVAFEEFMMIALNYHLICVFPSGIPQLQKKLAKKSYLAIKQQDEYDSIVWDNSIEQSTKHEAALISQQAIDAEKILTEIKQIATDNAKQNQQILSNVEKKIESLTMEQNTIKDTNGSKSILVDTKNELQDRLLKFEDKAVKAITPNKMYQKYRNDRENFFVDVKNPVASRYWQWFGKKVK